LKSNAFQDHLDRLTGEKMKTKEIEITRIYNAPLKLVWDSWTDLQRVSQWWGPRGFSITTHSKELKPGGHWHFTMHGPDGVDYPNKTVYLEVKNQSLLVYDHGGNDDQPPLFRVRAAFTEEGGKTTLNMKMVCESVEKAIEINRLIKMANGYSTWDRLAEYLEKELNKKEKFFISRSFNTTVEQMFELWTNPVAIGKWLSPTGTEMKYFRSDIKPGGSAFYTMYGQEMKLYGKCQYLEIVRPTTIKYLQQFCDENEKTIRHPMAPTWPETMLTVITIATESLSQTRVTIEWEPTGDFTKDELETFVIARPGMTMGWTGSFDKLEKYIEDNF
jgi:uncharacterized protein YndB with AHSA1/START domain